MDIFDLKKHISYIGLTPFIFVIIDLNFSKILTPIILKDFLIFYNLIIITFIGALKWQYEKNLGKIIIIYGFMPSFLSTICVYLFFVNVNKDLLQSFIVLFFFVQLVFDFYVYKKINENNFYYTVRFPITVLIIIFNSYVILL